MHIVPRISHVGGIENFFIDMIVHWKRKNDRIVVCTFNNKNNQELISLISKQSVQVHFFNSLNKMTFRNHFIDVLYKNSFIPYILSFYRLKKIILAEVPDLIIAQGEDSELISGLLNNKIKKVNIIHSEVDFPKNIFYRFILNKFSRSAFNYTFAVNQRLIEIPKRLKINYQVIQPFIDEANFKFNFARKFDKKNISIGYIGRIVKEKGLKELILALKILRKKYEGINLTIAGEGSYLDFLKKFTEKNNVKSEISFPGITSKPWEFYKETDIVILPSQFEAIPRILLEAMASGSLLISTNVGGISEIIKHETNGLLMEDNSPESIYAAVTRLIENEELRDIIRINAFKSVKPFFEANFLNQIEHCLNEIGLEGEI